MTSSLGGHAVAYILGMSHTRSRSTGPTPTPSLAAVQHDPAILANLPRSAVVELRRQLSHLAADVDAILGHTLPEGRTEAQQPAPEPDRLLTPDVAAARFGVTKRWLLAHADEIPGRRRLSRKVVRFSERQLRRFLDKPPV